MHQPKTKEQVEAELKQQQEATRQRAIVTGTIWPMLLKATKTIAEAQQLTQVLKITVQQGFVSQMKKQTVGDLKLREQIQQKAMYADYAAEFLDRMASETVAVTVGLLEGVENEIQRLIRKEQAERPLSSLKTDFIKTDDQNKGDQARHENHT